jgi:formylglycine-generating enzyme required for sulfatase activity/uncharacterized caspase-like protein
MLRNLLYFLLILSVTGSAQAMSLPYGRFHALVIGNQNYKYLKPLKTPIADAEAVAEVLKKQYGFTVDLLKDADRYQIMRVLSKLRRTMTSEKDNLLIYYAGHGYLDRVGGNAGYWQPIDAEEESSANWIATSEITPILKAIRARHVLIVSDSCYSGELVTRDSRARLARGMSRDEWLRRMLERRSRTALTSGGLEEKVWDSGRSNKHSVFAESFLEVLQENRRVLDGDSLFALVRRPVILNSPQTPLYGDIRMTGHEMGDFLLVPKELQHVGLSRLETEGDFPSFATRGDYFTDPITGMELVYIPKGCFQMGSAPNEKDRDTDEGPLHEVCVASFWMGKYEVTQGQWKKIMGYNSANFKKGNDYPVETVSWGNAQEFISKLNQQSGKKYRLPTEAEWEYAARAGTSFKYSGGDNLDAVAWYWDNCKESTHPVGQKKANAFGLYDMSGNVWEWCSDWYDKDYYSSSSKYNPTGPSSGSYRVLRGGSCFHHSVFCRSVDRYRNDPEDLFDFIGFRLVLPFQAAGS